MTTFNELVNDVVGNLQGFVRDQEVSTYITQTIDSDDLTVTINTGSRASAGIVEIGDELVWVDTVDRNTGTLNFAPWGRGYQNTTAAAHTSGDKIVFNPRLPKGRVKRAINDTLLAVGVDLPATAVTTFDSDPAVSTYALPAGTQSVLDVSWEDIGPSGDWLPVRYWDYDLAANTTAYPTGCTITIKDGMLPGQTVQVTVAKDPTLFTSDSDTLSVTVGLPDTCRDVIVYGACHRLVAFLDTGRLNFKAAEADALDDPVPFGSSQSLSRYFFNLYSQRLADEVSRFRSNHQARIRYVR
jgi:hypothetical protein